MEDGGPEDFTELAPTELNPSNTGNLLVVSKDKLTATYTGNGVHSNDVGSIQANRPVPRKRLVYYYEMTVLDAGDRGCIAIGFADAFFKLGKQPGWEPNSYGYHGHTGKKYNNQSDDTGTDFGPTFGAGDTVGAGINLEKQEIFFTRNGKLLGVAFRAVCAGPLFPTIGLHSPSEKVDLNFGQRPFRFDLDSLVREEQSQQASAIERVEVPAGVMHQLVRGYLHFYGYADTLRAFDAAAGISTSDDTAMADSVEEAADARDLDFRRNVRQKIVAGDVEGTQRLLRAVFPAEVAPEASTSAEDFQVHFHLSCQRFLEMIRQGRVEKAVAFAQAVLAPLRGRSKECDAVLLNIVALVAYEHPEQSPLQELLGLSHREVVADVVNAALLSAAQQGEANDCGPLPKPQVALERLLQQVGAVHAELHEANGGQGPVFHLREHLVPDKLHAD